MFLDYSSFDKKNQKNAYFTIKQTFPLFKWQKKYKFNEFIKNNKNFTTNKWYA